MLDSNASSGMFLISPFGSKYSDDIVRGISLSLDFADIMIYLPSISFFSVIIDARTFLFIRMRHPFLL